MTAAGESTGRRRERDAIGRRAAFLLALAGIGWLMFVLNSHTPLMMDDYDYSFSWATGGCLAGLGDIVASQAAHYRLWGGRSVVHFLAQLFLYLGKPAFNAANTVAYLLLLLEICALAVPRNGRWSAGMLLCAHALLFFGTAFFGTVFLWLDGACNYLWGTALALLPLLIARSEREGGFFGGGPARGIWAIPLCFLAGWTNENTACGVLAVMMMLLILDRIRGRRVRIWRLAAAAAQALGTAVMLLAPGNFARPSEPSGRGLAAELLYRFGVVSYCLLRYAGVLLLLLALALLLARRRGTALPWERMSAPGLAALLSAYALVGSPQISDRSFTAVIALLIAAVLAAYGAMKPGGRAAAALLAAVLIAGGWHAVCEVRAHEAAWNAQLEKIRQAAAQGEEQVEIEPVPSQSAYTMDIVLQDDPSVWPNSTLSRYYGVRIAGSQ